MHLDEQTPARVAVAESARRAMIPRSLLAECSARYSFCLEESTAAMIFHEFLAPSARRVSHLCQRVDRTLGRRVQRFGFMTAAAMITRHTNE